MTCATCRFAVGSETSGQVECHKGPPQVTVVMVPIQDKGIQIVGKKTQLSVGFQAIAAWPDIPSTKWCGAHEPKGAEK